MIESKILRLALKTNYDVFNKDKSATKAFNYLAKEIENTEAFDYLVTPGGFIHFKWPKKYLTAIKTENKSKAILPELKVLANENIQKFWNSLAIQTRKKIRTKIKFITFGIDSNNQDVNGKVIQCVQFVALFDTSSSKIIHWTGKSYPTTYDQKCRLIEFGNLKSHFTKVNNDTLCILGCHDLKMFSLRAKSVAGNERLKKIKEFDKLMKHFKPNLILQHPHNTDSYKIWNSEWKMIEKTYPFVRGYVSGIRYYNNGSRRRQGINKVIEKTMLGNVLTIKY